MQQIEFILNTEAATVPAGSTVRELLAAHLGKSIGTDGRASDGSRLGVAVAVDSAVVPRSGWNDFELKPGHRVELVTAAQGG
ncbi:thiamine biosynthesis protein ThiS [Arthrobacter sp. MYb211]|uniref:sulfur carrier protein ThiS n=1 Tax=Micrococcaceae TaxID=1268 RepID=UPI000BB9A4F3|nr:MULTISPECIES: sulfur carrier protein ThiS [Micrococcaceae]PCC29426.1 thiamine biosynthesis protein ThiS [Glutamicibacter sp. BW80]PRA06233.1 thiamine biosynthesis protein ThiS [Arthrobacter sp. MYb229]PRA12832.1 thiamine biosynthesis protein ThiS [Arthrobacter sp. MYb221]PRB53135.1 thiamine biosynthesis protein ThiS [Arthrobacter sp. MYb216]PRC09648.1 thiamine biosynthesis protein ThiS [Arthrobacter sp. MYb211]